MINVALADDHPIFRRGVAEILSKFDNICVVMEASNGKDLLLQMLNSPTLPNVCIIDINMPEMNGYDTVSEIARRWPKVRILALSMYDTELNIIKMLRCGANGYVLKDSDPDELWLAITEVHQYGYYHSDLVSGRVISKLSDFNSKLECEITDKELCFLKLCCSDLTYKEIADKMKLSARTIDGYRESLFVKLKTNSRTGLVMYAMKAGIADI